MKLKILQQWLIVIKQQAKTGYTTQANSYRILSIGMTHIIREDYIHKQKTELANTNRLKVEK